MTATALLPVPPEFALNRASPEEQGVVAGNVPASRACDGQTITVDGFAGTVELEMD